MKEQIDFTKAKLDGTQITSTKSANEVHTLTLDDTRYTLDTFLTRMGIFPIFYEETYTSNHVGSTDIARHYFAFYYDMDKKYKVLQYQTADKYEAGSGVPLHKLQKNSTVVVNGQDLKDLKGKTSNSFHQEHLEAMYVLIGDKPIKKTMAALYNIMDRMVDYPVVIENNGSEKTKKYNKKEVLKQEKEEYEMYKKGYILVKPPTDKFNFKKVFFNSELRVRNGYKYVRFNVPMPETTKGLTDVFGKNKGNDVSMHFDKVVGFSNINFISTARQLIPQYKYSHQFIDWAKALMEKK